MFPRVNRRTSGLLLLHLVLFPHPVILSWRSLSGPCGPRQEREIRDQPSCSHGEAGVWLPYLGDAPRPLSLLEMSSPGPPCVTSWGGGRS